MSELFSLPWKLYLLRGNNWALFSVYRPPSQSQDHFLENLGKAVDHYSEKYDKFLLLGDFKTVETDQQIRTFMNRYDLRNLVKEPTCFKTDNPPGMALWGCHVGWEMPPPKVPNDTPSAAQ